MSDRKEGKVAWKRKVSLHCLWIPYWLWTKESVPHHWYHFLKHHMVAQNHNELRFGTVKETKSISIQWTSTSLSWRMASRFWKWKRRQRLLKICSRMMSRLNYLNSLELINYWRVRRTFFWNWNRKDINCELLKVLQGHSFKS